METFRGDRLFLKEIKISDIDDSVMKWFEDEQLMKFYSSSKKKITRESLIASIEDGKEKGNVFTYGIFTNDQNILIGTIKLGPIHFTHKTADLVVLIGNRDYLGKGLSVDAIKLGNQVAFEKHDLRKLYGGMYESNIPSIKAYTRAGWLLEGRLKGFYNVEEKNEDRILVGCFNPRYFTEEEINQIKENENRYFSNK